MFTPHRSHLDDSEAPPRSRTRRPPFPGGQAWEKADEAISQDELQRDMIQACFKVLVPCLRTDATACQRDSTVVSYSGTFPG